MKKIFSNTRFIAIAFMTVFTVAAAPMAMANDSSRVNKTIPVELKLVGNVNDQPIFQLSYSGTEQDEFTIVLRDEDGNALYRENIKGEGFTKKFLLNKEEIGDGTLRFEISSKKFDKVAVYEVNRSTRQVEDMVINKL